jgi:hypothetical protein
MLFKKNFMSERNHVSTSTQVSYLFILLLVSNHIFTQADIFLLVMFQARLQQFITY